MGMPVSVELVDPWATAHDAGAVFGLLDDIDLRFSTYKKESEISEINRGKRSLRNASDAMKKILDLSEETKRVTHGYFDIRHDGIIDPSGIVKGWAILEAARLLRGRYLLNFAVTIAGDSQVSGRNCTDEPWRIGIENPFNRKELIKVLVLGNGEGVATSGQYIRKGHIYNPKTGQTAADIMSITVIGSDIYEADRFATAAFAMGKGGLAFIERVSGCEAYMVGHDKQASWTSGFDRYVMAE